MKRMNSESLFLKKLLNISGYINKQGNLSYTSNYKEKLLLGRVCLIHPNHVWSATREFQVHNPFDLIRVIKIQKKQIAPFEGYVFWDIESLSKNIVKVRFYAIPKLLLEKLHSEFRFVYPANINVNSESDLLRELNKPIESSRSKHFRFWRLLGLYIPKPQTEAKKPIISTVQSLTAAAVMTVLSFVFVSAYLVYKDNSLQAVIKANEEAVNEALGAQKQGVKSLEKLESLSQFLTMNKSALQSLQKLEIPTDSVTINRIELASEGATIYGYTSNSATEVMSSILKSDIVKSAKFTRPVGKNGQGEETFTIEVELHAG